MKVAFVHDQITLNVGAENTLREIVKHYPEAPIYCSVIDREVIKWLDDRDVRPTAIQKLPAARKKHYLYAPILVDLFRRMDLREFDVILVDSHSFAHQVRGRPEALHFCYYHTPARSLWMPEIDPRASGGRLAWLKKVIADRIRKLDLQASAFPNFVYANSQTTADRIRRFYKREVNGVIYPPVETQKWNDVKRVSDDEGFLFWGRLIAYKKVDIAIEAARREGWKLNIVGSGPYQEQLKQMAVGAKNVVFHGRLPDEQLKDLMSRSRGVVFPAYEDFGIVPVEAMAAGLPVAAYELGGASESIRPQDGVLFPEQTPESLAAAVRELEAKDYDPDSLKARAALFDVDRFNREYREAVESAMERHFGSRSGTAIASSGS